MSLSLEDLSANLMACVCDTLEAAGWAGDCCVEPAQSPALDACCEGGAQAWVVLQEIFPSTIFPVQDFTINLSPCTGVAQLVAKFEVGFTVCGCVGLDDGSPCPCETREATAMDIFKYLMAMIQGILCCNTAMDDCDDFSIENAAPLPVQGGCTGGTVVVLYGMSLPCCVEG